MTDLFNPVRTSRALILLGALASLQLLIHLFIHPDFGFHRDEFLYIDQGRHLAWGFLEVPPAISVLARLSSILFGESYFSYHVFAALAGVGVVFLTGCMVLEMGGSQFAQVLASVCVLFSPSYVRSALLFQPVIFEQLWWTWICYLLIRWIVRDNPRTWIWIGLLAGIGLLNKYSFFLFGFCLALGILFSPLRGALRQRGPWVALGLAILLFLPNLVWQIQNELPFFDHVKKLQETQFLHVSVAGFLTGQLLMNATSILIWLAGIVFFLFVRRGKPYRAFGVTYLAALTILLAMSGKDYYLLPAYPVLIAGGSFWIAQIPWLQKKQWAKGFLLFWIVSISLVILPYAVPILSVERSKTYFAWMAEHAGLDGPLRWEDGSKHSLPMDYADMMGWEEIAQSVAAVYHALPDSERQGCVIFGSGYVYASVVNYFREKYDLPTAVSFNGSYYLWGPGESAGNIVLTINVPPSVVQKFCREVELAKTHRHPNAREKEVPICIGRRAKATLKELWPKMIDSRY